MPCQWLALVVDAEDPSRLASFWAAALDLVVLIDGDDGARVGRDLESHPWLAFVPVSDPAAGHNRWRPQLEAHDVDDEVERLVALGATRRQNGIRRDGRVELADPEGNELSVIQ